MKLAFVTGFPNTILIELQQVPNIETLTMGDLLARVLTTGDPSQDVAAAVCSLHSGIVPVAKGSSISSVIYHRCNSKGHIAKDCRKRGTHCFQCGEIRHWARNCLGSETGGMVSALVFFLTKM